MRRAIFPAVLLCLTAAAACIGQHAAPAHYAVRRDLSIYFTNADQVIADVRAGMKARSPRLTLTFRGVHDHMDDFNLLVRDLMRYVYAETDAPDEGDYLFQQTGGYEMQYRHQPEDDGYFYEMVIVPEYYTTPAQERDTDAAVEKVLSELHFTRNTTDYEKVRAVYDYVCAHVAYDQVHRKNDYYHLKSTAYGALINGRATCQGYAVLIYRLLREAGVGVRIIQGTAETASGRREVHAWNIVRIDGLYYNLDATWDDQLGTETYFLRCDAHFDRHMRDAAYADAAFSEQYPMALQDYDYAAG